MRPACFAIYCCAVLIGIGLPAPAYAAREIEFVGAPAQVEVYDFVELVIRVKDPDVANPFTDVRVKGTFEAEGDDPIRVDGFCDSPDGSVFRVRFMPRRAAQYRFEVTYQQDEPQNASRAFAKGSFRAVASERKGLLRVDPENRWHFIWAGTGEHYFWNGTTTYYLMGWDDETIRRNIDRLHRLKINRLRVLVYGRNNPRPWRQPVVPTEKFKLHLNPWLAQRPDNIKDPGFDLSRFNLDHWRKYERLLRYAREKDVIVSVILYIGGQVLPTPFKADSEEELLYYRYAVARFAAFSNVTWDLGNEYNFHRKAPEWADRMGHRMKKWDPYDHLASAHNVKHRTPESTWLDMQLIQHWDSGQNAFMFGQRRVQEEHGYIIPQINEEYGYEDLWEKHPGQRAAETRRKNAWEIYMAGCYQTAGESSRRGTGVPPDTGGGWVNGRGDDTMTMLIGYGHIVDFFTAFDWWNYHPFNKAVNGPACCLAKPDQTYILYFREGGRATLRLDEAAYQGRWFNPRTGKWGGTCVASGPVWTTPSTPDGGDWVLRLEKDDDARDETPPRIISVIAGGNGRKVLVELDELPDTLSATDPRHYKVQPGVTVQQVSVEGGPYGKTVALSVSGLKEDQTYTLHVAGVKDRAGSAMEPTKWTFTYIPAGRPLVELAFDEPDGRSAANTGTARETIKHAKLTPQRPAWSTNTPVGGGSHSLDFGKKAGEHAVDLDRENGDVLEKLASFTITAWVNCVSRDEGPGGNRVVHMADTLGTKAGFDLVFVRDGRLKIGINEWPDNTKAVSSPGIIAVDEKARRDNWRFIAVSYDSTAQRDHVRFYVGSADRAASLDKAVSYDQGPLRAGAGVLTVGHFNPPTRRNHGERMFRGLIDEVRICGSKTDGAGALSLEEIRTIQKGGK